MPDEPLAWIGIGLALGSKALLATLRAGVPDEAFDGALSRSLFTALGGDRAAVATALARLGVTMAENQTAADAILAKLRATGLKRAQRRAFAGAEMRSVLMTPEQFTAWCLEQSKVLTDLREKGEQVAGKIGTTNQQSG